MLRFVTLNYLNDPSNTSIFPSNALDKFKFAILRPVSSKPNIREALHRSNFTYHRACSIVDLIRECNAGEGRTLLMYWSRASSDSHFTLTMSNSSSTSDQGPVATPTPPDSQREKDLRHIAQQTEISCRQSSGFTSPVSVEESQRELRARIADSLTFSSPAPSAQAAARSCSILSSVCALLSLSKQGSTLAPKQAASIASFPNDNICRICFGAESAERLVRPCSCRGTIAGVHRTCLERWLLQASTSYCELCRHHYVVTRTHKWSWLRSLAEWARSGRGRALAADAWRGAALGAASVLGTARALHACDRALQAGARRGGGAALAANLFSSLLIGIIGALNGLLTTWMLLKIQEHQLSWQAWRDSTLHVHVTLADDPRDVIPLDSDDSQRTVVATDGSTADRSTNVADPFMVALPFVLPEP